jgi:hypothetical protein
VTATLTRFLGRRFPDLDLRVVDEGDAIIVRYGVAARRGRRFPVLFSLRKEAGGWVADREYERGVIGETLERLRLSEQGWP